MYTLYCRDKLVLAWYDNDPHLPESAHPNTRAIPWPDISTLKRAEDGRHFLTPTIDGKDVLATYARWKHSRAVINPISVTIGDTTHLIPIDQQSLVHLQYLAADAKDNPKMPVEWVNANNEPVTLSASQVKAVYETARSHVRSAHSALHRILAGINSGEITKQEHIDNWSA